MRIQFCKEYNPQKIKGAPCVLIHCFHTDSYWMGKKIGPSNYEGCVWFGIISKRLSKQQKFHFSEEHVVKNSLSIYYINESDFDNIIDKIKDGNSFKMLIGMLEEI